MNNVDKTSRMSRRGEVETGPLVLPEMGMIQRQNTPSISPAAAEKNAPTTPTRAMSVPARRRPGHIG